MTFQDRFDAVAQPPPPGQQDFQPPPPQRMADAADTAPPDQPTAPAPTPSTPSPQAAPAQPPQGDAAQFLNELTPRALSAEAPPTPQDREPRIPPAPDQQWPPTFQRRPPTYYPSMANRPPGEWGKDHFTLTGARNYPGVAPGPFVPQPWEIPGIYQGLGNMLSRWGSGYVGPMAGMMGRFSGAWMKGFAQGQMLRARLLHQQMRQTADETARRQEQELDEYGSLFAVYKDKPDQLREALRTAAEKYQDRHMQNALDQGGIGAAERLLQWRDGKHSDLKKSNAQAAKDEKEREKWGPLQDSPTDESGTPVPRAPVAPEEPAAPTHPGTDEPLPEPQPGLGPPDAQLEEQEPQRQQLAMAGDQLPTQEPSLESPVAARQGESLPRRPSRVLDLAKQQHNVNRDTLEGDARKAFLNGGIKAADAKAWPDAYRNYVGARVTELENELNDVVRSNLRGDAVYAAVNARVPGFGDNIKGYVEGSYALPKKTARSSPILDWIQRLGAKADPSFSGNRFAQRANVVKSFTTGQDGRAVTGYGTGNGHINTAISQVDEVERVGQITNMRLIGGNAGPALNRLYQGYITQVPENAPGANRAGAQAVLRLQNTIKLVAPEIARAMKGAAPTLREIEDVEGKLSSAQHPDDLRHMLLDARHLFIQRAHELNGRFQAGIGRDPVRGISSMLENIERGGGFKYDPAPEGTINAPISLPPGQTMGGTWQQLLRERDPGSYGNWGTAPTHGPVPPAAPAAPVRAPAAPAAPLPPGWNIRER